MFKKILLLLWGFIATNQVVSQSEFDSTDSFLSSYTEISFGQTLLFISNSKAINIKNEAAIVLPTSSVLLFAELRTLKKIRIPVFFNYPLGTKQFLVNGVLINEQANPTAGLGIATGLGKIKTNDNSYLEFEAGLVASMTVNLNQKFVAAPVAVARVRMIRKSSYTMYLGASYSFGLNTLGMLYGSGTIF